MKKKHNKKMKKFSKSYLLIALIAVIIILLGLGFFKGTKIIYQIEDRKEAFNKAKKEYDNDNTKTVGWLRVQGTDIDTPIVSLEDYNDLATISSITNNYLINNNSNEYLYNKVDILGHNIINLSSNPRINSPNFTKFEGLMAFIYPNFVKDNKYIQYRVNGKDYLYKIYAVRIQDSYKGIETLALTNYTKKETKEYIDKVKKESIYKFNVDTRDDDNLISLITCTRFFGPDKEAAFVVDARMLRQKEKARNYTVKTTDNYKKIEKYMEKGDETNG